jgi:proto-oncogene C-crk
MHINIDHFITRQPTNLKYIFREDTKVSHYIINKIQQNDQIVFRIGDQQFSDLPELLAFYKLHYLDTTPLRRPAQKRVEKVIAKFDFDGSVSEIILLQHAQL